MNWDDLRFFLALSRGGSMSAAGRVLGVRHTTVARRIAALESRLETRLFDRQSDGYAMTQAGENLYTHALSMESLAQAVDRDVFGQDAELAGPLKLTASHDSAECLIIPRLRGFCDTYPQIDLQLLATSELVDLASRQADIALRMTAKPPDYLVGREVMPLQHGVYGTKHSFDRKQGPVNVILFRGEGDRPQWVADNFPQARVTLRVDDVPSMLAATRNHLGLSRIPCYIGDSDPRLRRMDAALEPSNWGVWILSHVDLRATARVRVCREFLLDVIEQQRPLIQGENSKYVT